MDPISENKLPGEGSAATGEPDYKAICRVALRVGEVMASHGAEAYRIEDTVVRILNTTGFAYAEAHVSATGLMLTLSDRSLDHEITLAKRIKSQGSDLSQISLANDISRRFVAGKLTPAEAEEALDGLEGKKFYSELVRWICFGLTSGCFAVMFGGSPLDAVVSFLIGLCTGIAAVLFTRVRITGFMWNFLCSTVLGLSFLLLFVTLSFGQHAGPILSGAIMPLVPGMLLTVAIRDLLKGDYVSGMSRGIEATLIALSIAAGMSIVLRLFESAHGAFSLETPSRWLENSFFLWLLLQTICSFISSIGFVILFDAEPRHLLPCGLVGAITWLTYCLVAEYLPSGLAIFAAAMAASLLSFLLAHKDKAPVTVFFTGGIFCLVPGAGIFQTMYYLVGREIAEGSEQLLSTLEAAGLIAIAMAITSFLLMLGRKRQ